MTFSGARLNGADLTGANLERARFTCAPQTVLKGPYVCASEVADLAHANLSEAQMAGADLRGVDLQSVQWWDVTMRASPAHLADLRDARNLTPDRLSSLIGNAATLLPDVSGTPEMAPFVCTCWIADPTGLVYLIIHFALKGTTIAELRAPDKVPRKTGTPWPLHREVPWGAQRHGEGFGGYENRRDGWNDAQSDRGPCPLP